MSVFELEEKINSLSAEKELTFIGIDGFGGAGKSTIAEKLRKQIENVTVIHMDEFDLPYNRRMKATPENKPIGADTDYQRLINQVIAPLKIGRVGRYQRYNWDTDKLEDWIEVDPKGIILIEGVYALRSELASFYDFRIWIDCAASIRLQRGLQRDGENSRNRWINDWIPMEKRYELLDSPKQRADWIIHNR